MLFLCLSHVLFLENLMISELQKHEKLYFQKGALWVIDNHLKIPKRKNKLSWSYWFSKPYIISHYSYTAHILIVIIIIAFINLHDGRYISLRTIAGCSTTIVWRRLSVRFINNPCKKLERFPHRGISIWWVWGGKCGMQKKPWWLLLLCSDNIQFTHIPTHKPARSSLMSHINDYTNVAIRIKCWQRGLNSAWTLRWNIRCDTMMFSTWGYRTNRSVNHISLQKVVQLYCVCALVIPTSGLSRCVLTASTFKLMDSTLQPERADRSFIRSGGRRVFWFF